MKRDPSPAPMCGPDCRYRLLYEGSQASLSDLAAKQAGALSRVSRLRSGIIMALKQAFPSRFSDAETRMGGRMSSADDEVLLALMSGFLASGAATSALRAALTAAGFTLPPHDDLAAWAAAIAASPAPTPAPTSGLSSDVDWTSVFGTGAPPSGHGAAGPDVAPGMPPAPPTPATAPPDREPSAEQHNAPVAPGPLDDLFSDPAPERDTGVSDVSAPASTAGPQADEPDPWGLPDVSRIGSVGDPSAAVVRPGIVSPPPRPARRKAVRAPEREVDHTSGLDVPLAAPAQRNVGDDTAGKLLASVCIPRPVFTADLVAQTGDAALVDSWEQQCRDSSSSALRFITAKQRHRARGNLVIPYDEGLRASTPGFAESFWNTCLSDPNLRGARLYETAVLLHRFAAEMTSAHLGEHTLTLRLKQKRGLIGIVASTSTDPDLDQAARAELSAQVGALAGEALTLVAVLSYASGPRALEVLQDVVSTAREVDGWTASMPIVAAHSWEFAADAGASALPLT